MMNIDLTWIFFFPGTQVLPTIIEKIDGIWLLMDDAAHYGLVHLKSKIFMYIQNFTKSINIS